MPTSFDDVRDHIRAVDSGGAQFDALSREARQKATARVIHMNDIPQEEPYLLWWVHGAPDARLNLVDVFANQFAINGNRDGAGFVRSQYPNASGLPSIQQMQALSPTLKP